MNEVRNPFTVRTSEQASDEQYLAFFSSRIVDILPADELWDRLILLASPPGAGKTTLMRLFTPSSLLAIHRARTPDLRELVTRLERLGALSEDGPRGARRRAQLREAICSP